MTLGVQESKRWKSTSNDIKYCLKAERYVMTKTWQRQIDDKKMTMWGHYEWWEMRFRWDLLSLFLSWWVSLPVTWETEVPWWGGNRLFGASWWLRWWRVHVQCRRPGFDTWGGKIPWRRAWYPTPVFLPREFHGQRSLVGSHRVGHAEPLIVGSAQSR